MELQKKYRPINSQDGFIYLLTYGFIPMLTRLGQAMNAQFTCMAA